MSKCLAIPFTSQTPHALPMRHELRRRTRTYVIQIKKTNEVEQINVNLGENGLY